MVALLRLLFVVAVTLTASRGKARAHRVEPGQCPTPAGMENFDKTQFFGKWNVIEVDSAVTSCITLDFSAIEGGEDVSVVQDRNLPVPVGNFKVKVPTVTGTLSPVTDKPASHMHVKWPVSGILSKMTYTVLNTDYTGFAMTFECQQLGPLSRMSGTILSRGTSLTAEILQQLKTKATSLGLDFSELRQISHEQCDEAKV